LGNHAPFLDQRSPQSRRHRRSAAPTILTIVTQGSQSLVFGLTMTAASQMVEGWTNLNRGWLSSLSE